MKRYSSNVAGSSSTHPAQPPNVDTLNQFMMMMAQMEEARVQREEQEREERRGEREESRLQE